MSAPAHHRILAVDLDGTLHDGDVAWQLAAGLLAARPWRAAQLAVRLGKGRLHLKRWLAGQAGFEPAALRWRADVLDFLRAQPNRRLVLATAAMQGQAEAAAAYLADACQVRFWRVLASDCEHNLHGHAKAAALADLAGEPGFDYIGDSPLQDPPVFAQAQVCHFVNPTAQLLAAYRSEHSAVFYSRPSLAGRLRRAVLAKIQQAPAARRPSGLR